jgi:hypothetical protein
MAARKKAAKKAAKKTVKKTRTAAQKAATAKLVALNKAKRAGKAPAKKAARKAPAKKATRRAASRPVFGPTATDAQLDMLERRYAGKVKRRSTLAAKRAEKEKSLTLADFKRGVVASAAPPKAGARRSGRKAQKVYTVAYVCAGPRRSGCGGGKKGSHVIATIR